MHFYCDGGGITLQQYTADAACSAKDLLTPDELTAIEKVDNLMCAMLDAGMDYHGIKSMLSQMDVLQAAS